MILKCPITNRNIAFAARILKVNTEKNMKWEILIQMVTSKRVFIKKGFRETFGEGKPL